ncbi:type I-E CRISPR-associated protein Cse1/CasA [Bifidobacterium myosotis]|uniref:Type I-E CRISPR-associated protein Cse1/CasA n=1 Tax=Bifidobacterium myosotis TaxID=1630166 RepID=A0A5M9ZKN1_9BIFI|nr:type I-E CRISPR-associated protein Cse1/CasA [Bifidobacterium myosotis]KAA8828176.1 type I-E CRISPR-associated protein Cse1/CasA [Bifidobacterium myosotis]
MTETFNLIDEPWLSVRTPDGRAMVGLRGLFADAGRIIRLEGDEPIQRFALHRLVMAVNAIAIHDGITPVEYLERHYDRFDLIDPEHPFLQSPSLEPQDRTSGLGKLLEPTAPGKHRAFLSRRGRHSVGSGSNVKSLGTPAGYTIGLAEAARHVVETHAARGGGVSTATRANGRDDPLSGGNERKRSPGGPLLRADSILVEGVTFADTLRLNPVGDIPDGDRPSWETDETDPYDHTDVLEGGAQPAGPVSMLTWRAARIRLYVAGGRVHDALVTAGDWLKPECSTRVDPMLLTRTRPDGTVGVARPGALWRAWADPALRRTPNMAGPWPEDVTVTLLHPVTDGNIAIVNDLTADAVRIPVGADPDGVWTADLAGRAETARRAMFGGFMAAMRAAGCDDKKTILKKAGDRASARAVAAIDRAARTIPATPDPDDAIRDACAMACARVLDEWDMGLPRAARLAGFTWDGTLAAILAAWGFDDKEKR